MSYGKLILILSDNNPLCSGPLSFQSQSSPRAIHKHSGIWVEMFLQRMYLFISCQTREGDQGRLLQVDQFKDKERGKDGWRKRSIAWKSLRRSWLFSHLRPRWSPLLTVYILWSITFFIWWSYFYSSSCRLNDNSLHSSLPPYHNQLNLWPCIFKFPLTPYK